MEKDSNNNRNRAVCTNKQIIIYEILNKAQNLITNNNETLLSSKFVKKTCCYDIMILIKY